MCTSPWASLRCCILCLPGQSCLRSSLSSISVDSRDGLMVKYVSLAHEPGIRTWASVDGWTSERTEIGRSNIGWLSFYEIGRSNIEYGRSNIVKREHRVNKQLTDLAPTGGMKEDHLGSARPYASGSMVMGTNYSEQVVQPSQLIPQIGNQTCFARVSPPPPPPFSRLPRHTRTHTHTRTRTEIDTRSLLFNNYKLISNWCVQDDHDSYAYV